MRTVANRELDESKASSEMLQVTFFHADEFLNSALSLLNALVHTSGFISLLTARRRLATSRQ